ncbi:hypothetical protein ACFQ0D_15470, partial [Micromonospora zhanjiangensis]
PAAVLLARPACRTGRPGRPGWFGWFGWYEWFGISGIGEPDGSLSRPRGARASAGFRHPRRRRSWRRFPPTIS